MDEKVKAMARRMMNDMSGTVARMEKFPVRLPEDPERTMALLLGWYGTVVESRGCSFSVDENTESKVERVVKWMHESRKRGLLLCGTLGNGKTTMLKALKYMFGSRAVYMEAQQAYDYFKKNQSLPAVAPNEVLLLDDLGVEPSSYNDFGEIRYPLTELMMARYRLNATTVIATNYTFEQIGETYGDRIQDRMREMFAMITYTEPSYRK